MDIQAWGVLAWAMGTEYEEIETSNLQEKPKTCEFIVFPVRKSLKEVEAAQALLYGTGPMQGPYFSQRKSLSPFSFKLWSSSPDSFHMFLLVNFCQNNIVGQRNELPSRKQFQVKKLILRGRKLREVAQKKKGKAENFKNLLKEKEIVTEALRKEINKEKEEKENCHKRISEGMFDLLSKE